MNDDLMVTAYAVIDETMAALGHRSQRLAQVRDAEVLTVAVVAAKYCANSHERALGVLHGMRYLTQPLSASRYNRRLRALGDCWGSSQGRWANSSRRGRRSCWIVCRGSLELCRGVLSSAVVRMAGEERDGR